MTELDFPLGTLSSNVDLAARGERNRDAEGESERSDQTETHTAMLAREGRTRHDREAAAVERDAGKRRRGCHGAREERSDESHGHGLRASLPNERERSEGGALVDAGVAGRIGAVFARPVTIM